MVFVEKKVRKPQNHVGDWNTIQEKWGYRCKYQKQGKTLKGKYSHHLCDYYEFLP